MLLEILALIVLAGCASTGVPAQRPVKVYMHSVENHGFVRAQAHEIVPYEAAPQWMALTPEDFEVLILRCKLAQ